MARTLLFLVFVALSIAGGWLVLRRTGNYDIDYFTKILGWLLFIPGFIGLIYYHKWLGVLLFIISILIVIFIRNNFLKKEGDNENTY